ncbi:hypothetical protein K523DRAFT_371899 [Schizophyllum commune Tattone D]|nr:hypothetical protein K523DRAFT_371899 [Schizophyllum commune Tattone D]
MCCSHELSALMFLIGYGSPIDPCDDAHPEYPASDVGPLIQQSYPDDVLFEVFALQPHEIIYQKSTLLWLSHVCRPRWRAAALSYPTLWSRIRVNYEYAPNGHAMAASAHMIATYLVRSHSASLDICWMAHDSLAAVFCALLPHSSRWRGLHIISRIHPAISGARPQMPLLESARVEGRWYWSWTTVRDAFPAVPRLRPWTCNCPRTNELDLPWAQLTSIDFKVIGSECLSSLPSFMPQMTSLRGAVLRVEGIAKLLHAALKGSMRSGLRQGALGVLQPEGIDLLSRDLEGIRASIPAHARIQLKDEAGWALAHRSN